MGQLVILILFMSSLCKEDAQTHYGLVGQV